MPEILASSVEEKSCCCCFPKKPKNMDGPLQTKTTEADDNGEYWADLPRNLSVGKKICVSGTIQSNCSRFAVNLTCGKSAQSDIAFHLNPRLQMHYVVRNSRLNGQWGEEETTLPVKFNFSDNFTICIFIAKGEFYVELNKQFICSYKLRTPLDKLTNICVVGAVLNPKIEYFDQERFPQYVDIPILTANEKSQPPTDTPVTFLLPEGFQRGWQLEIYARVKILPHSFHINLQEGAHQWPHPLIHLHLNPRFSVGLGEPLFIRNAWIEAGWGQEERTPGFQFSPGSPFTMAIRRGSDHFSVWIDGKLAGEFKFRGGDPDKIDTLHIQGDLILDKVILDNKAKS